MPIEPSGSCSNNLRCSSYTLYRLWFLLKNIIWPAESSYPSLFNLTAFRGQRVGGVHVLLLEQNISIYLSNILSGGCFCEYVCPASVRLPRSKPVLVSRIDAWFGCGRCWSDLFRIFCYFFIFLGVLHLPQASILFSCNLCICFTGHGCQIFDVGPVALTARIFFFRSSVASLHGMSVSIDRRFMATEGRRRRRRCAVRPMFDTGSASVRAATGICRTLLFSTGCSSTGLRSTCPRLGPHYFDVDALRLAISSNGISIHNMTWHS
jgi:hypothetical protein